MMNSASSTQVEMVNENSNGMMDESAGTYKDGTYTQVGEYVSPGGPETIGVTITLANGVVSDVTVEPQATRPVSMEKQADFAANYKPMVVGKSIDEVMLTKVSGSSVCAATALRTGASTLALTSCASSCQSAMNCWL